MGQCASNKRNKENRLNIKTIISHKKSKKNKKMDRDKSTRNPDKIYPLTMENTNKQMDKKLTKGMAMSFGFKRRPTPMTNNKTPVAWEAASPEIPDANGNQNGHTTISKNPHKMASSAKLPCTPRSRSEGRQLPTMPRQSYEKFTFQTTRLPQPEPIRLIETKTAKTIANNNKRSAQMLKRFEEASSVTFSTPSAESTFIGENFRYIDQSDSSSLQERLSDNESTPSTKGHAPWTPNYVKSNLFQVRKLLDNPDSSCDQDGGEAMADDIPLSPEKSDKRLTLCEEDPKFAAVIINNNTSALLDDEILSPVDSLLSPLSEKLNFVVDNVKPIVSKQSPPGSPSNACSFSLSDDKEDFLIDDEIADQPELLFEDCQIKRSSRESTDIDSEDLMMDFDGNDLWEGRQLSTPLRRGFLETPEQSPRKDSLILTKANHSEIQKDIIGIRTMLLTLKKVLNESDSEFIPLKVDGLEEDNNNNEIRLELADLRRQILFLQGQLEDKEKAVSELQKKIDTLSIKEQPVISEKSNIVYSNAATQTERSRPLSTGVFSLTTTPVEETSQASHRQQSLFRLPVK
ncbi:hypothetical protein ABEB36_001810 [Hypothenemus hampei]|uniref:Uncharacterized protein n=1 Tax=Hypothenemus hampei TaxID=57062 RepID=A0ABD1FFT2_HYPHA